MKNYELKIEGMSCEHCVAAVTGALLSIEGGMGAEVDLAEGIAEFHANREIPRTELNEAIIEVGYQLTNVIEEKENPIDLK